MKNKAIVAVLSIFLSMSLYGCAGVSKQGGGSTEGSVAVVKAKNKKKSSKEKIKQASAKEDEEKQVSDNKDQKSDDSKKADDKSSDSKSDSKGDSSQSKQDSGSSQGSGGNSSSSNSGNQSSGNQKKWVAEQGHWETDYSQVWVPNVVYTRHERYICSACGATFDSFSAWSQHSDAMWEQGKDHGAYIDDSYTTTEDQGHYEQQATGQHWVVDVAGHWE